MKTDCSGDHQCCKENVLRREETMKLYARLDTYEHYVKSLRDDLVKLRARLAERERRIRLARRELSCVRGLPAAEFGPLAEMLDLRRPLPATRRRGRRT